MHDLPLCFAGMYFEKYKHKMGKGLWSFFLSIQKGKKMRAINEASVTIAGHDLTFQESMTLRVAMNDFLLNLDSGSLGNDDTGRRIAANYRLHARAILRYIHEEAK